MSVAAAAAPHAPAAQVGERCPLCHAPLHSEQEWCLRCGAAARTRLAASPNWKAPLAALLAVVALALGALAAALVKLAADSGPPPPARTATVTRPAAAVTPTTALPPATGFPARTATTPFPRTATPRQTTPAPRVGAGVGATGGTPAGTLGSTVRKRIPNMSRQNEERLRRLLAPTKGR